MKKMAGGGLSDMMKKRAMGSRGMGKMAAKMMRKPAGEAMPVRGGGGVPMQGPGGQMVRPALPMKKPMGMKSGGMVRGAGCAKRGKKISKKMG